MTHTLNYTLTRDDEDIELEIEYSVSRYYPARGPSWSSPGEPAEGGEIEELEITRDGVEFRVTNAERDKIESYVYETHDFSEEYEYD